MGDLTNQFGGKLNGELIRADDWNGLIAGIEAQLTGLETRVNSRITALEPRLAAAESSLAAIVQRLAPLETLAASLLSRQRRINLNTTRTTFAVGERAEIVAHVTDLLGAPLNLANAADRPWIDFVTVWGTLKAAPGFANVAGTGGRTVTVQVNASGDARVLLRAEAGLELAEEQELEVSAVLGTNVGTRNVATAFLNAPTPGSTDLAPAYAAVTSAYQRADTNVMRNYIDATYLAKPGRSFTPLTQAFTINWRDEHATVLAFMKPDDNPGSPDGAMAVANIRVTFRDWIYPWIMTQFMPVRPDVVGTYKEQFGPKIRDNIGNSVAGMWEVIENRTKNAGILGAQREYAAAQEALKSITLTNPPNYLQGVVQAVGSGLAIQRGLAYGQAVAPLVLENVAPAVGVSMGYARADMAAVAAVESVKQETSRTVGAAEARIMGKVAAETALIRNDAGGRVQAVESLAQSAKFEVDKVNQMLGSKAGVEMVTQLLKARK